MKQIIKLLFIIISFSLLSFRVAAEDLWLKDIPIKQLKNLYNQIGYDGVKGYLMLDTHQYPRIFLKNFPKDFSSITDEAERNVLFIKIVTPLALKLNEDLMNERKIILNIQKQFNKNNILSKSDISTLETVAKKYDLFTRLQGADRYKHQITELLNRVDRIPPSIIITAAAIETNWGASRVVKEGNSLYKILEWHTNKGLKPIGENTDDSYRIKTYPDIYSSIQDYALKINSHRSFALLRNFRREIRELNNNLSGSMIAPYVYGSSNLKNYAGLFDYTLSYYEFLEIDKSTLTDKMIDNSILKKLKPYVTKM